MRPTPWRLTALLALAAAGCYSAPTPLDYGVQPRGVMAESSQRSVDGEGLVDSTVHAAVVSEIAPAKDPEQPAPEAWTKGHRPDRKMIYSGSFTVLVTSVDEAIARLLTRTEELGGYLAQRQDATLTVRIPAAEFQTIVAEVPRFGRVIRESMSAKDVTREHMDLTIRLENAEASRKRLLALLEKATKMEDVIKIEEALRRLTGEIESMKAQLELLNHRIAYSTVTITFQPNAPETKPKVHNRSRFDWINRIGVEQDLRRF